MNDNLQGNESLEGAPLSYGYDPQVAKHLGLGDSPYTSDLNYDNIAKHLTAAMNLDSLMSLPSAAPVEGLIKIAKESEDEDPSDPLAEDSSESPEEDEPDSPEITQDMVQEALDNLESSTHLKNVIKEDPSVTREFQDLLSPRGSSTSKKVPSSGPGKEKALRNMLAEVSDPAHPHNTDFEFLAHTMGAYDDKDRPELPSDSYIRELAGKLSKNSINDPHLGNIAEGLNRAMNVMVRHLYYNKDKGSIKMSPSEMLSDMVSSLASGNNFKRELEAYRKAGNFPMLGAGNRPEKRVKARNNKYVKITFPHFDDYFSKDAYRVSKELHRALDKYMLRNRGKGAQESERVKIKIVMANWVGGARPVGDNVSSAMVLSISGEEFMKSSQVDALERAPEKEPEAEASTETVKTASGSLSLLDATKFKSKQGLNSPVALGLENLTQFFVKWFTYAAVMGDLKTATVSATLLDDYSKLEKGGELGEDEDDRSQFGEFQKWIITKGMSPHQMLHAPTAGKLAEEFEKELTPKAKAVATELEDFFYHQGVRSATNFRSTTNLRTHSEKEFIEKLPEFMLKVIELPLPEEKAGGVNSWIAGSALQQEGNSSAENLNAKMLSLIHEMLITYGSAGDSRDSLEGKWEEVYKHFEESPEANVLVALIKNWGEFLLSVGKHEVGRKFSDNAIDIAKTLADGIEYFLVNDAPGKSISNYVTTQLKSHTGNITQSRPRMVDAHKPITAEDAINGNSAFEYMVYVTSSFQMLPGMESIVLRPHKVYELVCGDKTFVDDPDKSKTEEEVSAKEYSPQYMSGYVLQVYDGRPMVTHEEARLSKDEIAKFLEFVANGYSAKHEMDPESLEAKDKEGEGGELLNDYTSHLSDEIGDLGFESRDPIFEEDLSKFMRGRSLEDISKFIELHDKSNKGHLAKALNRTLGSHNTMKDGEVSWNPSKAAEVLVHGEHSPYHSDITEGRIDSIATSMSKDLPSIKHLGLDKDTPANEVLEKAMKSKEVSEEFLKLVLTMHIPLKGRMQFPLYNALYQKALKTALLNAGLTSVLELTKTSKKSEVKHTSHQFVKNVSDMVEEANKELAARETGRVTKRSYTEAWDKAKGKDPELFDKLFKKYRSEVQLAKGTSKTTSANLTELLLILADIPEAHEVEGFDDLVTKDQLGAWKVGEAGRGDKAKVVNEFLSKYFDKLLSHYGATSAEDLSKLTGNAMFSEMIQEPKQAEAGLETYEVRALPSDPKAAAVFAEDLKKFMVENEKVGGLTSIIKQATGSRLDWESAKAGVSGYRFTSKTKEKVKDVLTQKEVKPEDAPEEDDGIGEAAPRQRRKRSDTKLYENLGKGMNGLLDHYQENYHVNKPAQALLSNGRDIVKGMKSLEKFERHVSGSEDLTKELIRVLRAANDNIAMLKQRQGQRAQEALNKGKKPTTKMDYDDSEARVGLLSKYLINSWLHKKSLGEQKRIQELLKRYTSKDSTFEGLSDPDIHKVLISVANAELKRPAPGMNRSRR